MKLIRVIQSKIVKKDNKYQVQSEKGKNLGTYDTKSEAEKRLKQVEMFKHMKSSSIDSFVSDLISNNIDWDIDGILDRDIDINLYNSEYSHIILQIDFDLDGYIPSQSSSNKWTAQSDLDYYGHSAHFEDFSINKITLNKIDNQEVRINIPVDSPFGKALYESVENDYRTMEDYFPN